MRQKTLVTGDSAIGQTKVSPNGRRWVAFGAPGAGPPAMVIDGSRSAAPGDVSTAVFSPDSKRIAYWAGSLEAKDRQSLILDGRTIGTFTRAGAGAGAPMFSKDGLHTACIWRSFDGKQEWVVVDGKTGPIYSKLTTPVTFASDGTAAYYARRGEGATSKLYAVTGTKEAFIADGEQCEGYSVGGHLTHRISSGNVDASIVCNGKRHSPYQWISDLVFSPDGTRVAYTVKAPTGVDVLILDGVDQPDPPSGFDCCAFSPDSRHFAYFSSHNGKAALIVDGVVKPMQGDTPVAKTLRFSPAGKHLSYIAMTKPEPVKPGTTLPSTTKPVARSGWKYVFVMDDVIVPSAPHIDPESLTYSPDESHYAFVRPEPGSSLVTVLVDGVPVAGPQTAVVHRMAFSADGNHFAYLARKYDPKRLDQDKRSFSDNDRYHLVLDGLVVDDIRLLRAAPLTFGPDNSVRVYTLRDVSDTPRRGLVKTELQQLDISLRGKP